MSGSSPRCPGCGAPCDEDAARCLYCGSALATVTCASCYHSMFKGSRFCSSCGAEVSREVVEGPPLQCPRCQMAMQRLQLGRTHAAECAECGGLWVDPETLQVLCNRHEQSSEVVSALAGHVPRRPVAPETIRYIPCPTCAKLMNRVNFSHSSGVIVDVCKHHGVWLDRGELQRVVGFVEGGGLARQRAREKEALAEEERRLLALRMAAGERPFSDASASPSIFASRMGRGTATDGVAAVLIDIAGLFR